MYLSHIGLLYSLQVLELEACMSVHHERVKIYMITRAYFTCNPITVTIYVYDMISYTKLDFEDSRNMTYSLKLIKEYVF
jgi:hypothetical protein